MDLEALPRQTSNNFPYLGYKPAALVVVGQKVILAEEFEMTTNNKSEADTCRIKIPLDNIDSSVFIIGDDDGDYKLFDVRIFTAYLSDESTKNIDKTIDEISNKLKNKNNDISPWALRFEGFVHQPEWEFSDSGNYIHLSCIDFTAPMREIGYAERVKDQGATVSAIINNINKIFDGSLEINIDNLSAAKKSLKMGNMQKTGSKEKGDLKVTNVYNGGGKTVWAVLQDVATKVSAKIVFVGRTVYLKNATSKTWIWDCVYLSSNNAHKSLTMVLPFKNFRFRYGTKGRTGKNAFVIVLEAKTLPKSPDEPPKPIMAQYPPSSKLGGANFTKVIKRKINQPMTNTGLQTTAKNLYFQELHSIMTGSFEFPFANNFLYVTDGVTFNSDAADGLLSFLAGKPFIVSSLTERFSKDGYSQHVEFQTDLLLWYDKDKIEQQPEKTVKEARKTAPKKEEKKIQPTKKIK